MNQERITTAAVIHGHARFEPRATEPRPTTVLTHPRGNQDVETRDVERGEEKLARICGN
jgi:hypothetical protein